MPVNKYALLRYRIIDRCLCDKRHPYPSRETLRIACEEALYGAGSTRISLGTIDKDLRAMKEEEELGYFAPITYHYERKGYYYKEEGYSIAQFSLNDEDLEALRFAAAILQQFREMPLLDHYRSAVDKIVNRVMLRTEVAPDDLSRFIQFEQSSVSRGHEFIAPMLQCIQDQQVCHIQYLAFRSNEEKSYTLHPLLLKEYRNRWYVIAQVPERSGRLTFGLERITQFSPADDRFVRPKEFDPERFFRYSIGITESREEPADVILRFGAVAGKLVMSQPLHTSQRLLSENEEFVRITLRVIPTIELISEILSFGSQVVVESPSDLAQTIASEWRKALEAQIQITDGHTT